MMLSVKEHEMHHRGQLMFIERMVGLVPHNLRDASPHDCSYREKLTWPVLGDRPPAERNPCRTIPTRLWIS
jgi:hypothetical protein